MSTPVLPTPPPRLPRPFIALAFIALCGLVLCTRTYARFEHVRLKVVTQPAAATPDGALDIVLPASPRLDVLGTPAVLILQLTAADGAAQSNGKGGATGGGKSRDKAGAISLRWNDNQIDTLRRDGGGDAQRFDVTLPERIQPRAGDTIKLRGSAGGWAVEYLEIANVHGSSRGLVDLVFVPRTRAIALPRSPLVLAIIVFAIAFLQLRAAQPIASRPLRLFLRLLGLLIIVVFLVALVSPLVSPYTVGIAFGTFMMGAAVLCIDGLRRAWTELRDALYALTRAPRLVDSVLIALVCLVPFVALTADFLSRYDGNYSGFLHITKHFVDRAPVLRERPDLQRALHAEPVYGYDGQFVYLMAFDPFLLKYADNPQQYREMIDAPPYRYGRIGFSVMTKLFALNRAEAFPQVMVWLILASHFLAVLCLGAIAVHYGRHPAWALLYVGVPGYWASLWAALPESIAGLGLLTAWLCLLKSRVWIAALALALSLLMRETGAIFVIALAVWYGVARREPRQAAIIASAIVPLALWRLYVGVRLYSDFGREAFLFNAHNVGAPFRGLIELLSVAASGAYQDGNVHAARGAIAYAVVITVMLGVGLVTLWKRRDAIGGAMFGYGLLAVSLTYSSIWVAWGNGERGTYEMFLLAIVALLSLDRREVGLQRLLAGSMVMAACYTLYYSSFAADLQRLF